LTKSPSNFRTMLSTRRGRITLLIREITFRLSLYVIHQRYRRTDDIFTAIPRYIRTYVLRAVKVFINSSNIDYMCVVLVVRTRSCRSSRVEWKSYSIRGCGEDIVYGGRVGENCAGVPSSVSRWSDGPASTQLARAVPSHCRRVQFHLRSTMARHTLAWSVAYGRYWTFVRM